jgi:Zn-dependent M28 family amino/carboxypeptidase
LKVENFDYPSVNVIAKVDGTDPKLKEKCVIQRSPDHDGVGPEVNGDPIWNGADDNASVTVAMLAIGSAWSTQPADRLYLFGTDLRKGLIVLAILLAIPPLSCLR